MDVVYFVPLGLILIFILMAIGLGFSIIQNLTKIILTILVVVFVIIGIIIIIKGITDIVKGRGILNLIAEVLRGTLIMFMIPLVEYWLDIGEGTKTFNVAEFVLLGTFDKLDDYAATIIVALVLIFILCILMLPNLVMERKSKFIFPIISICIVCVMFFGGFKLSLDSEMNNSYDSFNWESPEYEVIKDTSILQDEVLGIPVKTGTLKKGTKLYIYNSTIHSSPDDVVKVSDGKRVGNVLVEDLKALVTYSYIVNTDADLFGVKKQEVWMWTRSVQIDWPSSEVIATVRKGTQITKIGTHATYLLVEIPGGTRGYIKIDDVTEIRE